MVAVSIPSPPINGHATSIKIEWTLPTKNTDGTPCPASEIQYTQVMFWLGAYTPAGVRSEMIPPPLTNVLLTHLTPGTWSFQLRCWKQGMAKVSIATPQLSIAI